MMNPSTSSIATSAAHQELGFMQAAAGEKRGHPPKKPNAAASSQDQHIKTDPDLKKEEDAGSVNNAFISASEQEEDIRLDDANITDSKEGLAACIDVTDETVSISSLIDDTLASASSIPAMEKAIKDLQWAAAHRMAKIEETVQVHDDRVTAVQRRLMAYKNKSSQLSKLKQAKQLLAPVLGQVSPLQGILRGLEHDLQPQLQQAFTEAMLASETFYNLHDAVSATIRDFDKNLEAEAKHVETELQEAAEDALKARKSLEAIN